MTCHTFATDVLDATEGDLYAVKELLGAFIDARNRGLSAFVADEDGQRDEAIANTAVQTAKRR